MSRPILWEPTEDRAAASRMADYQKWLAQQKGLSFDDYPALWQWSVDNLEPFWQSIWDYFDLR
ncbi:MAG TPA: hypothetical protein DCX13_12515, partial [Rhodobacteraceae bacterium]|nr:hypothetical protein [Paracoccaceae bacterium]